ncbi:MAG: hypothetical protein WCG83_01195 [Candidatus Peregrinibacteria bacterium]
MLNNRWLAGTCILGMLFAHVPTVWASLPGAHSATVSGNVFLGGNYIEVGIHSLGSFGTSVDKPESFYGTSGSSKIGLSSDNDGFGNGYDLRIDYFLPGSPEERWVVGYNGNVTASNAGLMGTSGIPITSAVTNTSAGDTLSAELTGALNSKLQIRQQIQFGVNDKYFKNTVTLTNIGADPLTSVRYMRSFDPDNTVYKGGSNTTTNEVTKTIAIDGAASVLAETTAPQSLDGEPVARYPIFFYTKYAGAVGSTFGFSNTDPYAASAYDSPSARGVPSNGDRAITMNFDVGTLAPGGTASFTYYTSLDSRDPDTVAEEIAQADSSSSSSTPTSSTASASSSSSEPSGGHRGHGTALQTAFELHSQTHDQPSHPAAQTSTSSASSSSSSRTRSLTRANRVSSVISTGDSVSSSSTRSTTRVKSVSSATSTGDYVVIIPSVNVLGIRGTEVLTKDTPVNVIQFVKSGTMAQIKLPNGKTGFIPAKAIGKK